MAMDRCPLRPRTSGSIHQRLSRRLSWGLSVVPAADQLDELVCRFQLPLPAEVATPLLSVEKYSLSILAKFRVIVSWGYRR